MTNLFNSLWFRVSGIKHKQPRRNRARPVIWHIQQGWDDGCFLLLLRGTWNGASCLYAYGIVLDIRCFPPQIRRTCWWSTKIQRNVTFNSSFSRLVERLCRSSAVFGNIWTWPLMTDIHITAVFGALSVTWRRPIVISQSYWLILIIFGPRLISTNIPNLIFAGSRTPLVRHSWMRRFVGYFGRSPM